MDSGSSNEQLVKRGHQQGKKRKQATYRIFHTFHDRLAFLKWWKQTEQEHNWRSNSRHPHSKGMVEYYYCKRMRDISCPALLRVIVEAKSGEVSMAKADDRHHNHDSVDMRKLLMNMEPFPMQTARVVNIAPTHQQ